MLHRTLWLSPDGQSIEVLNQTLLPHRFQTERLHTLEDTHRAIREMIVRGAPLIAATAGFGMYFACRDAHPAHLEDDIRAAAQYLRTSRPTAVNLFHALHRIETTLATATSQPEKTALALATAQAIVEEDVEICRQIGVHGLPLLEALFARHQRPVRILTHCNAGMLGCIEWGTITSPIYQAAARGIPVEVWVDETRPRNQGANLTAWELGQRGIPHTLIVDNTGGLLMQQGLVDIVLVGADRVTRRGDVANKIGTYLKALAAADNEVPFYVALPSTTIDWAIADGATEIPIETRSPDEVRFVHGKTASGELAAVQICPDATPALNYGFDITPARLVTGFITERGICAASAEGLAELFGKKIDSAR